jgi:hypothetical protein
MRFSSVLAFHAPAQRSGGVRKCRALAGRLRRRRAAALVSRGCSPGVSVVASLAAAAPPARTSRASAGLAPLVAAGAGGVRAGGIAATRMEAPRARLVGAAGGLDGGL